MGTIEYLNCTITFYKGDEKVFTKSINFFCDLWGMLHSWLNENNYYTKAVIEWNGKKITVDPTQPYPTFEEI